MKKINYKKLVSSILIILICGVGLAAANVISKTFIVEDNKINEDEELRQLIDSVTVSDEVMDSIGNSKDSLKNINSYKKIVAKKEIPDIKKAKLDQYIERSDNFESLMILYDYMCDNFFTYQDLDNALKKLSDNYDVEDILNEYLQSEQNYESRLYEDGEIDYLLSLPGITLDDLKIAEIISQRGVISFEDYIVKKTNATDWITFSEEIGLINNTGTVQKILLSDQEIKECAEKTGLSEEESAEKIILLKKANVKDDDITEFIRTKKSFGDIRKESFNKEYR